MKSLNLYRRIIGIKNFFGIKLNMEEIQILLRNEIQKQLPVFDVSFYNMPSSTKIDSNKYRFLINCHFLEKQMKILDLLENDNYYQAKNIENFKIFTRMNAAQILFLSFPYFINNSNFDGIVVCFYFNDPKDEYHPIRLYGTSIMLEEIKYENINNAKELFPYFINENSHIEDLLPRFPSKTRLTVDCCDTTE
jgi:hypothetical protein